MAYLVSSVLFGLLWTYVSVQVACLAAAATAAVLLPCCALLLRSVRERRHEDAGGGRRAGLGAADRHGRRLGGDPARGDGSGGPDGDPAAPPACWSGTPRPDTWPWSGPTAAGRRARPNALARTPPAGRAVCLLRDRLQALPAGGARRVAEPDQGVPDPRRAHPRPGVGRRADGRLDRLRLRRLLSQLGILHPDRRTRPQSGRVVANLEDFTIDGKKTAGRRQLLGRQLRRATTTPSTPPWPPATTCTWSAATSRRRPC